MSEFERKQPQTMIEDLEHSVTGTDGDRGEYIRPSTEMPESVELETRDPYRELIERRLSPDGVAQYDALKPFMKEGTMNIEKAVLHTPNGIIEGNARASFVGKELKIIVLPPDANGNMESGDFVSPETFLAWQNEPIPEKIKIATAEGGSIAKHALGKTTEESTTPEVSQIDRDTFLQKIIDARIITLKQKLDSGMHREDLIEGLYAEIEDAENDIEGLEDEQETVIKEAVDKREVAIKILEWLNVHVAKEAAKEAAA